MSFIIYYYNVYFDISKYKWCEKKKQKCKKKFSGNIRIFCWKRNRIEISTYNLYSKVNNTALNLN